MSTTERKKFCPQCGTERGGNAQFCGSCGFRFTDKAAPGDDYKTSVKAGLEKASGAMQKAGSVRNMGETVKKYVQDPLNLTVAPPAHWDVIVGDMPVSVTRTEEAVRELVQGTAMVDISGQVTEDGDRAIHSSAEKISGERSGKRIQENHTPVPFSSPHPAPVPGSVTPPESHEEPPAPARHAENQSSCPSCGKPIIPGKKFCGTCGAKIEGDTKPAAVPPPQPVCPTCGKPIIPGKKFCGTCGAKIEGDTKPAAVPPPLPVCPSCGKPITPGKKFCGNCGHNLD